MHSPPRVTRSKQLDALASVSMILASCVLIWSALRLPVGNGPPDSLAVGNTFPALGELTPEFAAEGPTLILWLNSRCSYCTNSMEFYRRLVAEPARVARLVAAGREPVDTLGAYLQSHGVIVDNVVSDTDGVVRLYSTPTAVQLDRDMTIRAIWFGQLPALIEHEVKVAVMGGS